MSITISKEFVHLGTTQYRHSNDNYQTSQRKPQDISHQIHQDCNSKRSWLCGGHHLTRQCMYGNESNLFAKKKKLKKPHHVNSDFWNVTLNGHCGTVFITKPMQYKHNNDLEKCDHCQSRASGRPFCRDHGDILCCTEPYHANVDMMIPGSFHRRDTFRSAIMSTKTSVRSSLTHESGMVFITEPCSAKTRRTITKLHNSKH